jgi:4-amino-4-deoxy-L-arabinose transferase-like glycosyltransferase
MSMPLASWPTSLAPALRLVWSRTLFPGASPPADRPRRGALFALILLPGLLLYPWLGFRLLEPDEGRYAEIPREMLGRGEWVVPTLQSEPYLDKPPLLYWLVNLSYRALGVSDAAARLVPALAVHVCILASYLFGCRYLGHAAAWRGALLLSLMPGLVGVGRLLTLDGLLTLWTTLGLYAGFAHLRTGRHGWPCAIACGLGVLTKGPVALILVLAPLAAWRHMFLDAGERPRILQPLVKLLAVVAAINLPWYALISLRQPGFLRYFFWQHNLERFFDPFDHVEPVWYFGPILLAGLMPATLWLVPAARALVTADAADRRSPELAFCLLAGGWCVLFFSLSGCKLPTYILPAFPPLALAVGALVDRPRLFRPVVIGWFALTLAAHAIALPWYAHERSPLREADVVRQFCADPAVTVVCFPRNCDSVGFYLGRDDLKSTRSKHVHLLIQDLLSRRRTVVLFTHRHSLEGLRHALPKELTLTQVADFRRRGGWLPKLIGETPWGLCDIGVVERRTAPPPRRH